MRTTQTFEVTVFAFQYMTANERDSLQTVFRLLQFVCGRSPSCHGTQASSRIYIAFFKSNNLP